MIEQTPRSALPATLQRVIFSGRALHFSPAKRRGFSPPLTVATGVRSNVADLASHKASFNPGLCETQACFSAIATCASLCRMLWIIARFTRER